MQKYGPANPTERKRYNGELAVLADESVAADGGPFVGFPGIMPSRSPLLLSFAFSGNGRPFSSFLQQPWETKYECRCQFSIRRSKTQHFDDRHTGVDRFYYYDRYCCRRISQCASAIASS